MELDSNLGSVMESNIIQKNEAILKNPIVKRKIVGVLICLIIVFTFFSCEIQTEDNPSNPNDEFVVDSLLDAPLSPDFFEFLKSLPVLHITVDDFDFENLDSLKLRSSNETMFCQSAINQLFFEMGKSALNLTESINKDNEGENKPAQTKLAYVYGSNNHERRYNGDYWVFNPKTEKFDIRKPSECMEELYGLDCSGYVQQIFNSVGYVGMPEGSEGQFNAIIGLDNKKLITSYFEGEVIVEELDKDKISQNNLQNGDIIFKHDVKAVKKFQHVGIILKTVSTGVGIFQSIGGPNKTCAENKSLGPVFSSLSNDSIQKYFDPKTGKARVLRIYPKIFEVEPKKIHFDNALEAKSFEIKTSYPVKIEEIKSLNEDICTVQSSVFGGICGDTTIHTINVFPNESLSPGEYKTEIVVNAKIKGKDEKKSVSIEFVIPEEDNCTTFDNPQGVVINGVRWATRNLGASSPCDHGDYYTWDEVQNVFSAGWSVPICDDFDKLSDQLKVTFERISLNGISGWKFTDKTTGNTIFLPAPGNYWCNNTGGGWSWKNIVGGPTFYGGYGYTRAYVRAVAK
jgi:hypothetical protein